MELRVLKYFLTVCQEGNITAAAASLNMTQPALSRQLMSLEKEVGQELFVRGSRKISLTEAGEYLQRRAQELILLSDRILSDMPKENDALQASLYIGAGESKALPVVLRAAKALRLKYPGITFHFYSTNNRDTLNYWMETGFVDFALFSIVPHGDRYSHLKLPMMDTWGILTQRNSELAKKKYIEAGDLRGLDLIGGRSDNFRSMLSGWLGFDFSELNIIGTSSLSGNTRCIVEAGVAHAIIKKGFPSTSEKLCFREFRPIIRTNLYLVWNNNSEKLKAKEMMLKEIKDMARQKPSRPKTT